MKNDSIGELVPITELEAIEGSSKIIKSFTPKAGELNELYPEYQEIIKGFSSAVGTGDTISELSTAPEEKQALAATEWSKKAKTLRARMVKVRTSTQKVHDDVKKEYLPVTKAIDAINKKIRDTSQEAEGVLQFIAETEERIEDARIARLEAERISELTPYADGAPLPSGLAAMDDATWDAILTGWKAKHDQKLRDDQAEKERQEKVALGMDRKLQAAPYADYIPGFVAMDFSAVTEEEFTGILNTAKEAKKTADAEVQALRNKVAETPAVVEKKLDIEVVPEPSMTKEESAYLDEIKNYLFDKMLSAPTPAAEDLVRRAMEVLG